MEVRAYHNRGFSNLKKGKYDKVILDCNMTRKIDPANASAYLMRGLTYYFMKDYDKALSDVSKAESLGLKVDEELKKDISDALKKY